MKIRDIFKRIKSSSNRVKLITVLGVLGMALILVSELLPKSSAVKTEEPTGNNTPTASEYAEKIESRLEKLLSEIKGVGKAELILSVEGSEEYVYAEETETASERKDNESSEKYKNKLFVTDHSGSKDALVKRVINPQFNGALVICEGGGDALVKERVIKAVSAALDLPTSKICVECRKY